MRWMVAAVLSLALCGCYETAGEATRREDLERRVRDIERSSHKCVPPEFACKGGCCPE